MSKVYFTSDQHFGHKNVISYCARPFSSVEEMNETLIHRHNQVVKPEDTVYHLGDFSLSEKWVDEVSPRLNGKKFLCPGNHDFCHSVHGRKPQKVLKAAQRFMRHGWTVLPEQHQVMIGKVPVLLCHLPYSYVGEGDKEAQRYAALRPKPAHHKYLLCGHVHSNWRVMQHKHSGKLMYNVGVDVHTYYPVSAEVIMCNLLDAEKRLDLR